MAKAKRIRLIHNATILTLTPKAAPFKGDILIENGTIKKIAPTISIKNGETIDATGLVAIPGFIQTHIHLCQTLFRNLANDLELLDWLEKRIWPLEASHSPASLQISARLGILELIKGGTTAILDMGSVHGVEIICEEVEKSGLRASVGLTFMDTPANTPRNLYNPKTETLKYLDKLYRQWHQKRSDRLHLNLAPRFALSCSETLFRDIAEIAREKNLLIHTHASENQKEVALIREKCGLGNVGYYHQLGLTGERLCLAHCIWLDPEEIDILAETGSRVLHCPSSNLKLGSGIADVPQFLQRGILCSLGADGAPCNNNLNMFREMRLASMIQKPRYGPSAMPARTVLEMATLHGAETLHLADRIGTLESGKKADIILLDLHSAHTVPGEDLFAQLVYAARPENVHSVFIDGEPVMQNRRVLTIDEKETLQLAEEELHRLLQRVELS